MSFDILDILSLWPPFASDGGVVPGDDREIPTALVSVFAADDESPTDQPWYSQPEEE